ncbi:MAG: hypothetical protein IJ241_07720 [Clostridia bacterium]|nr:hypothetical protein [Clostridia bacterium]MBQ8924693.1 hypothetical protein [Clostridia bacterium]
MTLDLQPIIERKLELERVIEELTRRIANAPPGHLVISKPKGSPVKYYQAVFVVREGKRVEQRTYIAKKDAGLQKALAEKGYHEMVLRSVKREHAVIKRFLKQFPSDCPETIFEKMADERKALVEPYWESTDAFVERWLNEEYPRKQFYKDDIYYVTERGERVRSKSELIIANWLYQHGIPYRYECALELWDPYESRRITIYPDFTLLDPATGKTFYLEHFGMMSDEQYFRAAMDRLALYEANGYYVGESLILSFESDKVPLDIRQLGRRLDHYLRRDI